MHRLPNTYIADIVAASSCFPIVFEPINYPRDFFKYDEKKEKADLETKLHCMIISYRA